nr:hypothetical protein [Salinibacterium sp. PAMC 21357]
MTAHVEIRVDLALFITRDNQIVVPDVASDIVTRLRNLRLVSKKRPGLAEEFLLLKIEYLLIVEHIRGKATLLDTVSDVA